VRFTRAYSSAPTCIAARRSLLSGQFPATHGMVGYREGVDWNPQHTLPGELAAAGYETCWVGRSMHQHPPEKRFGFEHMVTTDYRRQDSEYMKCFRARRPDDWEGVYGTGVMHNDWTARPWHLEEDLHPTNWTVHEALRFLRERDASRPFFLVVSFLAAHPPLLPPAFYMERYLRTGVPEPFIGDWASPPPDSGAGMDVSSGRVERFGIRPMTVVDRPVGLEDVMPTLLDLAGVEVPGSIEGRSVLPLARGEDVAWRGHIHIEHAPMHHALTDGREKYVWFVRDGAEQLFDLVGDPRELHELSRERPDRLAHWRALMVRELAGRSEGFSDGERLVPGRPYGAVLAHPSGDGHRV
jgi:arylsulfatase A-like enzyme